MRRLALVLLSVAALLTTVAVPVAAASLARGAPGAGTGATSALPVPGLSKAPFAPTSSVPLVPRPSAVAGETDITPSCTVSNVSAPISVSGTTFTVTADFTGEIVDSCNGSTVLGGHHMITASYTIAFAFEVWDAANVSVQDLVLNTTTTSSYTFQAQHAWN